MQGILRHSMRFPLSLFLDMISTKSSGSVFSVFWYKREEVVHKVKTSRTFILRSASKTLQLQESLEEGWDTWKWQSAPKLNVSSAPLYTCRAGISLCSQDSLAHSHFILLAAINTSLLKRYTAKPCVNLSPPSKAGQSTDSVTAKESRQCKFIYQL